MNLHQSKILNIKKEKLKTESTQNYLWIVVEAMLWHDCQLKTEVVSKVYCKCNQRGSQRTENYFFLFFNGNVTWSQSMFFIFWKHNWMQGDPQASTNWWRLKKTSGRTSEGRNYSICWCPWYLQSLTERNFHASIKRNSLPIYIWSPEVGCFRKTLL